MPSIPYQFRFEANAVDELRTRIAQTRWPRRFTAQNWDFGVDQDYLRDVVDYWRDGFDFEDAERRINAVPNYLTSIDGLPIHHLHSRSAQEDAVPVLLLHGWPGSIVEFLEVIPKLSAPESAELESFHVVAPSLQGFGASPGIGEPGMTPVRIAHRMAALMRELGYEQFVVHGGDWGTLLATHIASLYPQRVLGLHVTLTHPIPPGDVQDAMALVQDHERKWLKGNEFNALDGRGYFEIQKTRPETLGFALNDSPAGWCAWVLDKFYQWTDCERDGIRDVRHAVSWEKFLANLSVYWFTDTISSAMHFYREQYLALRNGTGAAGEVVVPTGAGIFPQEILKSPRAWYQRRFPLVHWTEHEAGGHFGAMEQPEAFASDLRAFAQTVADLGPVALGQSKSG